MADIKISELNSLTKKASDDLVPIVDTSANETKKISIQDLINNNVRLIAVDSLAPDECVEGDKYFNTTTNLIYTATGTNTWGSTGESPIEGIFYIVFEEQITYAYDGTTLVSVGGGSGSGGETLKIGTILPYSGTTAPDNYMICDGSAISRTTYAELFAVIGTTFGAGNGSTTFNIPNLKGRVPVGLDSSQTEFDTLGEKGGSKYLQQHNHAYDIKINSGSGDVGQYLIVANNTGTPYAGAIGAISNAGTGDSGNLQPYQVVNYIIKVSMTTPTSAQIVDGFSESSTDGYCCDYVNNNFQLKGTILYQNNSGATGNITLNDAIENYTYYEIIPYGSEYQATKNRVGTNSIISRFAFDGTYIYSATETISLSGTALTKSGIASWYGPTSNPYQTQSTNDWYSIYQVIGYK